MEIVYGKCTQYFLKREEQKGKWQHEHIKETKKRSIQMKQMRTREWNGGKIIVNIGASNAFEERTQNTVQDSKKRTLNNIQSSQRNIKESDKRTLRNIQEVCQETSAGLLKLI